MQLLVVCLRIVIKTTFRIMKLNSSIKKIPLGILLEYREFDRKLNPAPKIMGIKTYSVEEVAEYIKSNPNVDPPILTIDVPNQKALLTDGNHRVGGYDLFKDRSDLIDVEVKYIEDDIYENLNAHVIDRFEPMSVELKNLI